MLTSSNPRSRYMWFRLTKSENSATHGPHQVAQTFISLNLSEWFFTSWIIPAVFMVSSLTGSLAHLIVALLIQSLFCFHFIEQPKVLVTATGTGLPANRASIALRASNECGVLAGFSISSMRPSYCSFLSLSKINTWGVDTGPYLLE